MLPSPQAVPCTDGRGGAQPAQLIQWIHAHSLFTSQSRRAHSLSCHRPCIPCAVQGAAVSGLLNFPVEQYPGEQQRYGPDLNAFLRSLW